MTNLKEDGPRPGTRRGLRAALVVAAALVGGAAGGAGGMAVAAGPWAGGWRHGHRLEHLQRMMHGALDSVGATTVQEDKAHDIIAAAFSDLDQRREEHMALHKQMLDLLRQPTIDRAAVEKLRSQEVADVDARTKKTVGAILDVADQLTPDQRSKLADRFAMMADRRQEMGGRRWRDHDGMDGPGRPMGRPPMTEDGGPDKG